jgi:hypothetical protein
MQTVRQGNADGKPDSKKTDHTVPRTLQKHEQPTPVIPETKNTNRSKNGKPTSSADSLSYSAALERHDGILPDQRHLTRHASTRPQKNPEHTQVHSTREL